jgi:hypothetical protein
MYVKVSRDIIIIIYAYLCPQSRRIVSGVRLVSWGIGGLIRDKGTALHCS